MVIAPELVWTEIDLSVRAVRDCHDLLNLHGLGAPRGALLCGPPGTGKSAISAVIAGEVVAEFTVIYVEARAGTELLSAVVHEAHRLGGPVLLVLEDVDLWCRDRATSTAGLSELLQAMDIEPQAIIWRSGDNIAPKVTRIPWTLPEWRRRTTLYVRDVRVAADAAGNI
jgi:cell division protease FtsH